MLAEGNLARHKTADILDWILHAHAVTPMQGIYRTLAVMPEPAHAASNYFWITDLLDRAQAHACPVRCIRPIHTGKRTASAGSLFIASVRVMRRRGRGVCTGLVSADHA